MRRLPGAAVWVVPMLLTAVIGAQRIGVPLLWRDELATWSAASRSVSQLWHMVHNVDAVLGVYYLVIHYWMAAFGDTPAALRIPSLLAMAGTAAVVSLTARKLGGNTAGITAGLVFALIPSVSRYAQEARPYAFVTFFAALATLLLLRALDRPSWQRWLGYGAALAAAGAFSVLALCLLAAHALVTAARCWRPRGDSAGGRLATGLGFCLAAAAAVAVNAPVIIEGNRQAIVQLGGLHSPGLAQLGFGVGKSFGLWPELFCSTAVAIAVMVIAILSLAGRNRRGGGYCLVFALVPVLVIWAASQGPYSYWYPRYLLFTVPAWAAAAGLAIAAAAARLADPRARLAGCVAVLTAIGCLGIPGQIAIRQLEAHNWWSYPAQLRDAVADYAGAARVIAEHERPGDGVVFKRNDRWMVATGADYYLRGRATPRDVFLARTPAQAGLLSAVECARLARCLQAAGDSRLWVVYHLYRNGSHDPFVQIGRAKATALWQADYRVRQLYAEDGIIVALMIRQ